MNGRCQALCTACTAGDPAGASSWLPSPWAWEHLCNPICFQSPLLTLGSMTAGRPFRPGHQTAHLERGPWGGTQGKFVFGET